MRLVQVKLGQFRRGSLLRIAAFASLLIVMCLQIESMVPVVASSLAIKIRVPVPICVNAFYWPVVFHESVTCQYSNIAELIIVGQRIDRGSLTRGYRGNPCPRIIGELCLRP